MAEKEKAPGSVAAASEAEDIFEQDEPKSSEKECITEIPDLQGGCVRSILMRGEENAITTSELRERLRCTEREVRERVEQERHCGALILAVSGKNGGYFLPDFGEKGINEMLRSYRTARAKALGY